MDWNVLIEAIIGLITVPIWALSLKLSWRPIVNIIKALRRNDKDDKL